MSDLQSFALRVTPYLIAILVAAFDVPSMYLRRVHLIRTTERERSFAARWSSASDVIMLPLVTFLYATTHVIATILTSNPSVAAAETMGLIAVFLFAYLVYVAGALFVISCNLMDSGILPILRIGGRKVLGFDTIVRGIKVFGILVSGVLDMFITYRFG